MIDQSRLIVLNDEQCAVLGPLVDVCRPRGKTEPVALREHFYLVITAGGAELDPAPHAVAWAGYVSHVNRVYRRTGTLWEGRYKSTIFDSERYVLIFHR